MSFKLALLDWGYTEYGESDEGLFDYSEHVNVHRLKCLARTLFQHKPIKRKEVFGHNLMF